MISPPNPLPHRTDLWDISIHQPSEVFLGLALTVVVRAFGKKVGLKSSSKYVNPLTVIANAVSNSVTKPNPTMDGSAHL